jgi:flavin reductase (DIM6/NTAB) family NADH-FMN oxidoreductase RutF
MASAFVPEDLDRYFATTVGFVTTHSSTGDNVMAAEWSFNISYEPMRVAVFISARRSTHGAIVESKEFGLNLASDEQFALASFAGGFSQREAHKLTSAAIATRPGEVIGARMIEGSLAQMECKLVATFVGGDHTEFVGEVVAARVDPSKQPLILYRGYHRLGEKIPRGAQLFLTLTPEGEGAMRADGLYYADQREGQRVALEAFDPAGAKVAEGQAVTDRGGFFEWRIANGAVVRAVGRVAGLMGEAHQ